MTEERLREMAQGRVLDIAESIDPDFFDCGGDIEEVVEQLKDDINELAKEYQQVAAEARREEMRRYRGILMEGGIDDALEDIQQRLMEEAKNDG